MTRTRFKVVALTFYQLEKPDILFDKLSVSPQWAGRWPVWSSAEQGLRMATDEDQQSPGSAPVKSNNARHQLDKLFHFVPLDKLNIKKKKKCCKQQGRWLPVFYNTDR